MWNLSENQIPPDLGLSKNQCQLAGSLLKFVLTLEPPWITDDKWFPITFIAINNAINLNVVNFSGSVWKPKEMPKVSDEETRIMLDLDDESSEALKNASESDLVDLAGILGLHSLLNQDQFYASITNKGQGSEAKFESIVRATVPKKVPNLPDNATDVGKTAKQVVENDKKLQELNWNNIKHIPRDSFKKLFEGLKSNTTLQTLDLANTGLTDGPTAVIINKKIMSTKHQKTWIYFKFDANSWNIFWRIDPKIDFCWFYAPKINL